MSGTGLPGTEPEGVDPTRLAALMDVVARLRAWAGADVHIHLDDSETGGHFASLHGRLEDVDVEEDGVRLVFTDERTALALYGDLLDAANLADPDSIYLDYRAGDVVLHRQPAEPGN